MDTKNKTHIYAVYKRPISDLGTYTDQSEKRWKKMFCVNRNQKKAGTAILISGKIDFKTKPVIRDKKGQVIMTKASS